MPSEKVTYGSALITLNTRSDGQVAIRWRENGTWKRTTRNAKDAKKWAQAKARELDASTGAQWITPAAREHLDWLRRLAGTAENVPVFLSRVESALIALGGKSEVFPEAAKWYSKQGDAGVTSILASSAISEFLAEYSKNRPSITVRGLKSELSAFAKSMPTVMLEEVTAQMLSAHIRRGENSSRTLRNRHSYWVQFFNAAVKARWWPRNSPSPISDVSKEKPVKKSPEIFTPDEGEKLLRAVSSEAPQCLSYLLIAGWLGCRPFECQRLLWSDLDEEQSLLHVRADVARKIAAERWIPIPPVLMELLIRIRDAKRKKSRNSDNICLLKAQNHISEIARRIGLKWSIDVLRHSRITYRLQEIHDIGRVAEESGNSPSEIRASYKRPIPPGRWEQWLASLSVATVSDWQPTVARPWTPEEDSLLGTENDSAIGQRISRQTASVLQRRLKLAIPAFTKPAPRSRSQPASQ